jgi:hypothetical protein
VGDKGHSAKVMKLIAEKIEIEVAIRNPLQVIGSAS